MKILEVDGEFLFQYPKARLKEAKPQRERDPSRKFQYPKARLKDTQRDGILCRFKH